MISSSSLPSSSSPSKKPKFDPKSSTQKDTQSKWRTGAQQRIYNRRLVDALRSTRAASPAPPAAAAIKDAADSALALTARGQSRWSRAILSARWRRQKLLLKAGGKVRRRRPRKPAAKKPEPPAAASFKERKVGDRLRALGRLVPGCRKLSTPSLLEEAADYVAALEVQVKAMRALADAMAAAALSAPAASGEGS